MWFLRVHWRTDSHPWLAAAHGHPEELQHQGIPQITSNYRHPGVGRGPATCDLKFPLTRNCAQATSPRPMREGDDGLRVFRGSSTNASGVKNDLYVKRFLIPTSVATKLTAYWS
jgi:hypothetical protein